MTGLTERAQHLQRSLDVSKIEIAAEHLSVDLGSRESINRWFLDSCHKYTINFIESLKRDFGIEEPPWWDSPKEKRVGSDPDIFKKRMWTQAWGRQKGKMFEWATALSLLEGGTREDYATVRSLNLEDGPFPIRFGDEPYYFWPQATIKDGRSGLGIRPDFALTYNDDIPSQGNTIGIVECKSVKVGGGQILREIWAKGMDLDVHFNVMAYHGSKSPKLERAAHNLGIGFVRDMFLKPAEDGSDHQTIIGAYAQFFRAIDEEKKLARFEEKIDERHSRVKEKRGRW